MTYLELSLYPRKTYHHPCLMISFQPLCRYHSVPRHLDCDATTFWGKGRGQESFWQIKQKEWSLSYKLAT